MKTILFIGGSQEAVQAAGSLYPDYHIAITDGDFDSPGLTWARKPLPPFWHTKPLQQRITALAGQQVRAFWGVADVFDPAWTLDTVMAWGIKIDGVLAVGVDCGPTVSYVAAALGLPHIPEPITRLGRDKTALKARLQAAGIAVPSSDISYIVKPNDGRGSRGITQVSGSGHVTPYIVGKALDNSPKGHAIAERFIEGDGVSVEVIVYDGATVFVGMSDRHYDKGGIVESGGAVPSKHYRGSDLGNEIIKTVWKTVISLGIVNGTIKLDIIIDKNEGNRVTVIEAAIGRIGGGYNPLYYSVGYGVDFMRAAAAVACGDDPRGFLEATGNGRRLVGSYTGGDWGKNKDRGRFKLALTRVKGDGK